MGQPVTLSLKAVTLNQPANEQQLPFFEAAVWPNSPVLRANRSPATPQWALQENSQGTPRGGVASPHQNKAWASVAIIIQRAYNYKGPILEGHWIYAGLDIFSICAENP